MDGKLVHWVVLIPSFIVVVQYQGPRSAAFPVQNRDGKSDQR